MNESSIADLERTLQQAQAQIADLQLASAEAAGTDVHFAQAHIALELGVRYVCGCNVDGDIAEFGTMSGRTSTVIAKAMSAFDRFYPGERKSLHLFDSFKGMPKATAEPDRLTPHVMSGVWGEGTHIDKSEADLVQLCARHIQRERIHTYPGWFSETLPTVDAQTRFGMLHIDCDLYQSTKDVLSNCFGRGLVSEGAAVFFDDWSASRSRRDLGERRAWDEAVRAFEIVADDCGEYGMGCRKFVVHSYVPHARE